MIAIRGPAPRSVYVYVALFIFSNRVYDRPSWGARAYRTPPWPGKEEWDDREFGQKNYFG